MFVGDKINANNDSLNIVLLITSQFTDIVFYQMYARYQVQEPGLDRWSKITNKPLINGDSSFTITDSMPRPSGPVADNLRHAQMRCTKLLVMQRDEETALLAY